MQRPTLFLISICSIFSLLLPACLIRNEQQIGYEADLVNIGGQRLYLHCTGAGSPTVILDAGATADSNAWGLVQFHVAKFTHVCSYDRLGTGRSDPATGPRSSEQMSNELNTLLTNADIKAPYIMVGHSMGGLNVRIYASQHPNNVVGMILVDSAHEDQNMHISKMINDVQKQEMDKYLLSLREESNEHIDINKSFDQARASHWQQDIPLIVLTRGKRPTEHKAFTATPEQLEKIEIDFNELQKELVTRSPKGKQIIAKKSGHLINLDEPDLIVNAIKEIVETVRKEKN